MKSKKKVLGLLVCAVLLVVGSVMGTLAYLQANTTVAKNTFTVGSVTIDLKEAKVDEYGVENTTADRVKANTYKLIPGHEYVKDPEVYVEKGSEKAWVFVKLENGLKDIIADTTIEAQMAEHDWKLLEGNVYYYDGIVDAREAKQTLPVFDTFKVKTDANVDAYKTAEITIDAYAVQADGFGTAAAAWAAAPATWGN